jgi:predicted helicase
VVSYIVRSLHNILKEHFGRDDGFANESVTVLDPAAGTLTFLADTAKLAVEEFASKYGEGGKENFIKGHILKNFYAFELMMVPYAVGHLKMSFLLEELGYKLRRDDRFKLYLTNTLEMEELAQTELPGMASLSEESHLAGRVKKEQPILVILGNPPYSGHSANVSEKYVKVETKTGKEKSQKIKTWIGELIENYKVVDGKPLGEKNPKWLQDDYVKFIRFAQWKIDQAGEGVLGFITNHSYLDNPTFRGMRQSLMNSFNEIYILDLHGNSLKKEKCPDGSKDENVFDIRQGVAIAIFIKNKVTDRNVCPTENYEMVGQAFLPDKTKPCNVYHSEIWGLREYKYSTLLENNIKTTKWKRLSPKSEFYLFIPREEKLLKSYEKYPKITEIFPLNGVGMTTARDGFVIDRDKKSLLNRIRLFKNSKVSDDELHTFFQINKKKGWSIRKAWNMLKPISDSDLSDFIQPVLYRPFDVRWIFYHDSVVWRTVKKVMHHMMQENLGLLTCRQQNKTGFYHTLICENIVESCIVSNKTREINYLFPLYLYPDTDKKDLFSHKKETAKREPNINLELFKTLSEVYKKELSPEEIFYYIYAVLYSNIYRTKYAEFLKIDFPRVPFTKDYKVFSKMGEYGKRLVDLHLLRSPELDPPVAKFQGKGENRVEKLRYVEKENRVYINQNQYFEGISKDVWGYQIGGYQVCDKWLKDRKGRTLDDIRTYCRIATAIEKTIEIQKAIDGIYTEVEKETVEFEK